MAIETARFKFLQAVLDKFVAGETDIGMEELRTQRATEQNQEWQKSLDEMLDRGKFLKLNGASK